MGAVALFAGPGARRALRPGRRGAVEIVGSGGMYLELDEDRVLLSGPRRPFGPLSLAVAGLPAATPGAPVAVEGNELVVGGEAIALDRARTRWHPVRCALTPGAGEALATVLAHCPAPPPVLRPGLRALERGAAAEAVALLAGLGEGLTPLGDDALAGYAAWRRGVGRPVELAGLAAGRSTAIGLAYLRCAELGELPEAAACVIGAIAAADEAAALAGLPAVLSWGATSGAALLWGVACGVAWSAAGEPGLGRGAAEAAHHPPGAEA
jgi:hypothetical protein